MKHIRSRKPWSCMSFPGFFLKGTYGKSQEASEPLGQPTDPVGSIHCGGGGVTHLYLLTFLLLHPLPGLKRRTELNRKCEGEESNGEERQVAEATLVNTSWGIGTNVDKITHHWLKPPIFHCSMLSCLLWTILRLAGRKRNIRDR